MGGAGFSDIGGEALRYVMGGAGLRYADGGRGREKGGSRDEEVRERRRRRDEKTR